MPHKERTLSHIPKYSNGCLSENRLSNLWQLNTTKFPKHPLSASHYSAKSQQSSDEESTLLALKVFPVDSEEVTPNYNCTTFL